MRHIHPREIRFFQTSNGREPFNEWFESIRDPTTQNRIENRLHRVALGNFGDCRSVGAGVSELRLHFGAGYRIYFGEVDNAVVLLLCGGDKSSQRRDILRAKTYWRAYQEIHQREKS